MEKVLLAINGETPDRKVFRYAVQLCQRIRAELNVLQIINPRAYKEYISKVCTGASQVKKCIEDSMIAVTFAEAGEFETAKNAADRALKQLFPESEKEGVKYNLTVKSGNPGKEILDYVNEHRDVVLAIYDNTHEEDQTPNKKNAVAAEIKQNLPVPLVMVST